MLGAFSAWLNLKLFWIRTKETLAVLSPWREPRLLESRFQAGRGPGEAETATNDCPTSASARFDPFQKSRRRPSGRDGSSEVAAWSLDSRRHIPLSMQSYCGGSCAPRLRSRSLGRPGGPSTQSLDRRAGTSCTGCQSGRCKIGTLGEIIPALSAESVRLKGVGLSGWHGWNDGCAQSPGFAGCRA